MAKVGWTQTSGGQHRTSEAPALVTDEGPDAGKFHSVTATASNTSNVSVESFQPVTHSMTAVQSLVHGMKSMGPTVTDMRMNAMLSMKSIRTMHVNTMKVMSMRNKADLFKDEVQKLPSVLDAELVRGVQLQQALSGFGQHWKSIATGGDLYGLSETVDVLDDFLSHDWQTSRVLKFLTMCIIYNAAPAAVISVATSVLCAILESSLVLDLYPGVPAKYYKRCLASVLSPFMFMFVFFFWQRIRAVFQVCLICRRRYVFLDKLCIHQIDEEKKAKGIAGLAGFLNRTERLVVLWSERYFKRLWCTFELAAWFHLKKSQYQSIHFMPVNLGGLLTLLFLVNWFEGANPFFPWAQETLTGLGQVFELIYVIVPVVFIMPCYYHYIRILYRELKLIPEHMANFDVEKVDCFCCTNNHVMPVGFPNAGMAIPCDRAQVYKTLEDWYGQMTEPVPGHDGYSDKHKHLVAFNSKVRVQMKRQVTSFGGLYVSYRHALIAAIPMVWFEADILSGVSDGYRPNFQWMGDMPPLIQAGDVSTVFMLEVLYVLADWCFIYPCYLVVLIQVLIPLDAKITSRHCCDNLCVKILCDLLLSGFALVFRVVAGMVLQNFYLTGQVASMLVIFGIYGLITLFIFFIMPCVSGRWLEPIASE